MGGGAELVRVRSTNSLENFRMHPVPMNPIGQTTVIERVAVPVPVPVKPVEVWRSRTPPPAAIDPTLSDILRRPPVGYGIKSPLLSYTSYRFILFKRPLS